MENQTKFRPNPKRKLMDQVKEVLRYYHYAYRTEQTYCKWILRYIRFYGGKDPYKETEWRLCREVSFPSGRGEWGLGINPAPGIECARVFI